MNKTNDSLPIDMDNAEALLEQWQPFIELMMYHRCAILEIETKLRVLNEEFSIRYNRNPIESINSRLKRPVSIIHKLRRKGMDITTDNLSSGINDIAGIRVICSFIDDIYMISDMLKQQDDIKIIQIKDYIKSPKPNGYRSLHMIVEIPIFLSTEKRMMRAEVQFRTIAMDFWASLEHKMKYKKDVKNPDIISAELYDCAETISRMDMKMQQIHEMIESDS